MLVLSRKEAERIRLGDSIVITVVRIGGDKVRLGIQAPKEMLVLRDELQAFETPAAAADKAVEVEATVSLEHCLSVPGSDAIQPLSRTA